MEITDENFKKYLLTEFENAEYLEIDHPFHEDHEFKDGYIINIEYELPENLILYEANVPFS